MIFMVLVFAREKMAELLLDPDIRIWVILPIFFITLLFGLLRHYAEQYLSSEPENSLEKIKDSQMLMRSRILRMNGGYISRDGFSKRKIFLNDSKEGYLKEAREAPPPLGMGDPSMATDMMKNMFMNVLPMVLLGGWISWTFSGFVITKVPFPLTLKFKPMLQRGIELTSLNASWVSSISWYFLNFFGLRSIFTLILGSDNRADQSRRMAEMQMNPAMMGKRMNMNQLFKDEWEALQVVQYKDNLGEEEEGLLGRGRGKRTSLAVKKRQ